MRCARVHTQRSATIIAHGNPKNRAKHLLLIDIGNAATKLGIWNGASVLQWATVPAAEHAPLEAHTSAYWKAMEAPRAVVACSVVPERLAMVRELVQGVCGSDLLVVGEDVPLPIEIDVAQPQSVGTDRICCAAAAHHIEGQACAIADLGTAITVDCVSDAGAFIGGAILPGVALQAQALAQGTSGLPEVKPEVPDSPLGQHTAHAIQSGITFGIAGAIKELTERYATLIGKWPVLIMTGGDAGIVKDAVEVVDKLVPHLCLRGIALAYEQLFED